MHPNNADIRTAGQAQLDRYYAKYPDPGQQVRANDALRFLTSSDRRMWVEPEKLAAGIVYALAEWDAPHTFGRDNPVKRHIRSIFKIDPDYISTRAAKVKRALNLFPQPEVVDTGIKAMVELIRAWAPTMREQHPELYRQFGDVADALTIYNKNVGTRKRPRGKRSPGS